MKQTKTLMAIAIAVGLGLSAPLVWASTVSQNVLKTEAKVTEAEARATALAKLPGSTVQSAELENEHGKLVWSFDIKAFKSTKVVEVLVDAKTGRIISKKTESPAEQAREAKADMIAKP